MIKKIIFLLLFSLFPIWVKGNINTGCLDSVVAVQIDVHAESGLSSNQNATINQNQTQSCSGNININNISQIHLGYNGANQNITINSEQSSPDIDSDIDINLPNIQSSIIIQQEIIVPDSAF